MTYLYIQFLSSLRGFTRSNPMTPALPKRRGSFKAGFSPSGEVTGLLRYTMFRSQ
jgi:hypothetical protein